MEDIIVKTSEESIKRLNDAGENLRKHSESLDAAAEALKMVIDRLSKMIQEFGKYRRTIFLQYP